VFLNIPILEAFFFLFQEIIFWNLAFERQAVFSSSCQGTLRSQAFDKKKKTAKTPSRQNSQKKTFCEVIFLL
jgi:hypothetical protein